MSGVSEESDQSGMDVLPYLYSEDEGPKYNVYADFLDSRSAYLNELGCTQQWYDETANFLQKLHEAAKARDVGETRKLMNDHSDVVFELEVLADCYRCGLGHQHDLSHNPYAVGWGAGFVHKSLLPRAGGLLITALQRINRQVSPPVGASAIDDFVNSLRHYNERYASYYQDGTQEGLYVPRSDDKILPLSFYEEEPYWLRLDEVDLDKIHSVFTRVARLAESAVKEYIETVRKSPSVAAEIARHPEKLASLSCLDKKDVEMIIRLHQARPNISYSLPDPNAKGVNLLSEFAYALESIYPELAPEIER